MKKILFDTDVIIEHLRGNERVTSEIGTLAEANASLAYTPITAAEIFRGLRSNERAKAEMVLGLMECLNLGVEIGRHAGHYLRTYAKSHGLQLSDALIAASSSIHGYSLCTFNWKHYPMNDIHRYRIEF